MKDHPITPRRKPGFWRPCREGVDGLPAIVSQHLEAKLTEDFTFLPDMRSADGLMVASDYSGDDPKQEYFVLSFLVAPTNGLADWRQRCALLRESVPGLTRRRFAFKSLDDAVKMSALQPFLLAADTVPGLCLTVAIKRSRIDSMFNGPAPLDLTDPRFAEFREWAPHVLEKAFLVAHMVSLLLSGSGREGQDVLWVSDEDPIMANEKRERQMLTALTLVLRRYYQFGFGKVTIGTTATKDYRLEIEDFAAIPDLAAGGLADLLNTIDKGDLLISEKDPLLIGPSDTRRKTAMIRGWFGIATSPLRKICLVVGANSREGRSGTGFLSFAQDSSYSPLRT